MHPRTIDDVVPHDVRAGEQGLLDVDGPEAPRLLLLREEETRAGEEACGGQRGLPARAESSRGCEGGPRRGAGRLGGRERAEEADEGPPDAAAGAGAGDATAAAAAAQ